MSEQKTGSLPFDVAGFSLLVHGFITRLREKTEPDIRAVRADYNDSTTCRDAIQQFGRLTETRVSFPEIVDLSQNTDRVLGCTAQCSAAECRTEAHDEFSDDATISGDRIFLDRVQMVRLPNEPRLETDSQFAREFGRFQPEPFTHRSLRIGFR